jgi:sugar phosphate isomerase/epimerase
MGESSRRAFVKTAFASAALAAVWKNLPDLMANPLGLPLGLQLYSVRDVLPKDYEGTLKQLGALGYREVEAAGFFNHTPSQVKQAMDQAGLHCVSAHYSLVQLQPHVDEIIQFGKDLGLEYIVCAAPGLKDASGVKAPSSLAARESMTLDDWRWNADQFNHIGERVHAAGMKFAYHNHTPEFRSENGMLHVKDFKITPTTNPSNAPPSTELGRGTIDYVPIFEAAKKAHIEHAFVEQEQFDMPPMEALKVDADYMSALKV